jgi:hypothetical protein
MRSTIAAVLATAVLAAVLAACGSSTTPPAGTTATGGSSPAQSCRAQYETWKNGPARSAANALVAKVRSLEAADKVGDIPSLVATLKAAGRGAKALQAYPMPKCADPKGYWKQFLVRLRAGADNASTGSGFGALLLAMGPLKPVPGIMRKLDAELKQNIGASGTGITGAFGTTGKG